MYAELTGDFLLGDSR